MTAQNRSLFQLMDTIDGLLAKDQVTSPDRNRLAQALRKHYQAEGTSVPEATLEQALDMHLSRRSPVKERASHEPNSAQKKAASRSGLSFLEIALALFVFVGVVLMGSISFEAASTAQKINHYENMYKTLASLPVTQAQTQLPKMTEAASLKSHGIKVGLAPNRDHSGQTQVTFTGMPTEVCERFLINETDSKITVNGKTVSSSPSQLIKACHHDSNTVTVSLN